MVDRSRAFPRLFQALAPGFLLALVPAVLPGQAIRMMDVTSGGVNAPVHWSQAPGAQRQFLDSLASNQTSPYIASARQWSAGALTYNVAVIGDGFMAYEQGRFQALFDRVVTGLGRNEVLAGTGLGRKLVFHPVWVPSWQSGASHRGYNIYRTTALGATYHEATPGDTTLSVDFGRAWAYARYAGPDIRAVLVLVNDGTYAATNWSNKVCVVPDFNRVNGPDGTSSFEDILAHEFLGHTVADLWDEYVYPGYKPDPSQYAPNCDRNPHAPKWRHLLGWQWIPSLWDYAFVGTYAGCTNAQHVRPTAGHCRMNSRPHLPFCTVCHQRIAAVLGAFH